MDISTENKNKLAALGLTIGFHIALFFIFILIVFITPIPPFEIKPDIIELGLGIQGSGDTDAGGSGQNDPDIATSPGETSKTANENDAPNIVVDENEEIASVKSSPNNSEKQASETPEVEVQKPTSELSRALAILKNREKHTGHGEGEGNTGGSGTGTKKGVGGGSETGHGNGEIGFNGKGGYDLRGRMLLKRPSPLSDSQEEGIVVVEIIVDEDGKVISATPGKRGSTTMSSNLYAKARQAALSVKFNASPEGIKEQRGTYTFVFLLE